MDKPLFALSPFFILGSVRSGTTMLRDLLRRHPNLECPEETHFFRWPHPYPTPNFVRQYLKNPVLCKHRALDGISEPEFQNLLSISESRRDLAENYGRLFLEKRGNPGGRWFDKSPQNVYGALLISAMFPNARLIHIHRNPLDVVASLYRGKTIKIRNLSAAINAWHESMCVLQELRELHPERLLEIPYLEVTQRPRPALRRILEFVGEDPSVFKIPRGTVRAAPTRNRRLLGEHEREEIRRRCEPFLTRYGYNAPEAA